MTKQELIADVANLIRYHMECMDDFTNKELAEVIVELCEMYIEEEE